MDVTVTVTTVVKKSGSGELITSVTTVERTHILDNPSKVRNEIANSDAYGKAVALNLDQVEAGFRR